MTEYNKKVTENLFKWLDEEYDNETKQAIKLLLDENNLEELADAFHKSLDYGSAGFKGHRGIGPNRVNKYTIGTAAQGISNYLKAVFPDEPLKVVVAHDNQINTEDFSRVAADVFSANGIHVYSFDDFRPSPLVSFAIRLLGCKIGIMLTKSDLSQQYIFKTFWNEGELLNTPQSSNLVKEIIKVNSVDKINLTRNPSLIQTVGAEIDRMFLEKITAASVNPAAAKLQHNLKIAYAPLHGTGINLIPKFLEKTGFTNIDIIEELPSADRYLNKKKAFRFAFRKADDINAELFMATDADSTRLCVAVKNNNNNLILLNGNQTAALLLNYILEQHSSGGLLKGQEYVVKTALTSGLIKKIAIAWGVKCYNTLPGFKNISNFMSSSRGKDTFIAAADNNGGFILAPHVWDSDAVAASGLVAEMTAHYKNHGQTLYQKLLDIYLKFGFFLESEVSFDSRQLMNSLRNNPPGLLGGEKIVRIKDYLSSKDINLITGDISLIELPKYNLLQFITQGGNVISALHSIAESKVKVFISVSLILNSLNNYPEKLKEIENLVHQIKYDLL